MKSIKIQINHKDVYDSVGTIKINIMILQVAVNRKYSPQNY